MSQHVEYPKHMMHPNYYPGSVGEEVKDRSGFAHHIGGLPARFPPVVVRNADDETYYAAKGYVPQGKSDPVAYAAAFATSSNYVPQEYPKWVNDKLVQTEEEERALLGIVPEPEPVPTLSFARSKPVAKPKPDRYEAAYAKRQMAEKEHAAREADRATKAQAEYEERQADLARQVASEA